VFEALRADESGDEDAYSGVPQPETVLAGFIGYTEFLSAMDNLFPFTETVIPKDESRLTREEKLLRAIFGEKSGIRTKEKSWSPKAEHYREMLAEEIKGIIQWRIPRSADALMAYRAVGAAFEALALEQFQTYPSSGLHWSGEVTRAEISRLGYRFFGMRLQNLGQVVERTASTEGSAHAIEELRKMREGLIRQIEAKHRERESGGNS
jgi:hypothetical protein